MAYSQTGIINMALGRIGVKRISAINEDSTPAIAANAVWEYIRDEVLQVKDWVFAKTRVALAQNTTEPISGYDYAYDLPTDFLRLVRDKKADPAVYPTGAYGYSYTYGDLVITGIKYSYIIETLPIGTLCLFTDYDNSSDDLFITYIRKVTDPQKYTAAFINALAFRLAAELALQLTEGMTKYQAMMNLYPQALQSAEAVNQSGDWVEDETGNTDWEDAGR